MIIENHELLIGCTALAAASFAWRLTLYRREMALKNAYGLIKFETFAGLLAHRGMKAVSGVLFVLSLIAAGTFYILGYQVTVEDGFAAKVGIGASVVAAMIAMMLIWSCYRKVKGNSARA